MEFKISTSVALIVRVSGDANNRLCRCINLDTKVLIDYSREDVLVF